MSTRRLHHHNLQDNIGKSYDNNDDVKDDQQQQPRTVLGNFRQQNTINVSNMKESHAVLDALSDGNSQLAKFLFVGSNNKESQDGGDDDDKRRRKRRLSWFTTNDEENEDLPSMGSWNALWFALALEPMHIRNERIIMLFEVCSL